jgi:1-deoxyxylulose-5-phosphate synthase
VAGRTAAICRNGQVYPYDSVALPVSGAKRGVPNAQIALAWVLKQPGISAPIIGVSKMKHLDDAVAALEIRLDESELKALAAPYRPHVVLGHS